MRQKLCRRLDELEKISAAAAERERPHDSRVLDELIAKAEAWHAVPENQVWLAVQPPEYFYDQHAGVQGPTGGSGIRSIAGSPRAGILMNGALPVRDRVD